MCIRDSITISGDLTSTISGKYDTIIYDNSQETFKSNRFITVSGNFVETISGIVDLIIFQNKNITVYHFILGHPKYFF